MYKYELHMHTSEQSKCAKSTAFDILKVYAEKGYTGVVITDHFFNSGSSFLKDSNLPWTDKVRIFSENFEKSKEIGKNFGIDVFFGFEFRAQGSREQLVYGVDSDFLYSHPDIHQKSVPYLCDAVREYGGVTSLAHPYREADYIDQTAPLFAEHCDCIEVYNYYNRDPEWNRKALDLAVKLGKGFTSGSDAHYADKAAFAGIATEQKITSEKQFAQAILSEQTKLIINGGIVDKNNLKEVL